MQRAQAEHEIAAARAEAVASAPAREQDGGDSTTRVMVERTEHDLPKPIGVRQFQAERKREREGR